MTRSTAALLCAFALGCSSGGSGGGTPLPDGGTDTTSSSSSSSGGDPVPTEPAITEVTEVEPNNGPDRAGMQNIGTFTDAKTVVIRGRLETGGNDGSSYTGDFDGFAFSVASAGGTMSLQVDWTGTADVDAIAYDAQLRPVGGDDTPTAKPISQTGPATAGEYMLVLYSKDALADWTVTLKYTKPVAGAGGSCVSTLNEAPGGGCSFTMNEPNNGESLTLPYKFGWRTDGCETPGKVYFYGNPPTEDNWISFQFVRGGQTSLLNVIGTHTLTAAEVGELRSDNGTYHWQLESFHGARSVGRTFTISPAVCK